MAEFKSTLLLLRFPFSFFLLPVFLFALSQSPQYHNTWLIFFILHILVYPASNGYNSYIDQDTDSIGGLENPPPPPELLKHITLLMDGLAIALSFYIHRWFGWGIVGFIMASRAYSAPWPRLKKYPIAGFLTVSIFQGGWLFFTILLGLNPVSSHPQLYQFNHLLLTLTACTLIGGSYPLSQIYQHKSDEEAGVLTMSRLLGIRGTLLFSFIMFSMAIIILFFSLALKQFLIFQFSLIPVMLYFLHWVWKIWDQPEQANFKNTMGMNLISSLFMSLGFILMIYGVNL